MVLDILAHFNWERPIYFAITVGRDNFMGLEKYFQLEGVAYRLVPYVAQSPDGQTGIVNTGKMYDRLVKQFEWGGLNNTDLYFDETNTRMVMNFRNNYSRLAESLFQKGDTAKAIQTLDKCMMEFPRDVVNLSHYSVSIIEFANANPRAFPPKDPFPIRRKLADFKLEYFVNSIIFFFLCLKDGFFSIKDI